ncbi:MAG TPA: FTR1 family protein [Candidatus Methylomirabilis sp.]|nr:FTR1 family protein [Candidatus Methylomirabilis sp.]
MGAAFLITLREAFEAALLLGLVYTYLDKIHAREQFHWVTLGGVLGLVASVAMGVAVGFLSGPLLDLGPDLIGATVVFLAVILLTWHAWWMQQHSRGIRGQIEERIDRARTTQRLWIVGLIAFTGVFREGAETVVFLWGIMAEATSVAGWGSLLAGVAGVATAALLGWAIFHGGKSLSLPTFFTITTVLILFLAAGLFSTGLGRLQSLGVLPMMAPLWDTSWLLSDRSVVGSFLAGLVGYRARPSLIEVTGYIAYLVGAGYLVLGGALHPAPSARAAREPAASRSR